jgi:predicted RNase H-like HicB family nuclease
MKGEQKMKYKYPALIIKEDDGFVVEFPDLEDVFTQGDTWEEAFENAEDVLNLMLWNREEKNIPIPKPASLDAIEVPENATIALIKADTIEYRKLHDTKSVRKNVSIPSWLNTLAINKNINFSNLLQNALMRELRIEK